MIDFNIFGIHINTEFVIFTGVIFFLGLTLGWFCRKGRVLMIFIGLMIFAPFLDFMIAADVWYITVPFVLGFLVHTAKPIYLRFTA